MGTTKKKKPSERDLTKAIELLLRKYPPDNPSNVKKAFIALVPDKYPELIRDFLFFAIYTSRKTSNQMAVNIMKLPRRKVTGGTGWDSGKGKGTGIRGKAKKWNIIKEAENILFHTENVIKSYDEKINKWGLFALLRIYYHSTEEQKTAWFDNNITTKRNLVRLVIYSYIVFNKVIEMFQESWDVNNKRQTNIVMKLLPENSLLYRDLNMKGKSVTGKSIKKGVDAFKKSLHEDKPHTKSIDAFKYLAHIYISIYIFLDLELEQRKDTAIKNIKDIINTFPLPEDRVTILRHLENEFDPLLVALQNNNN